MARNIPKCNLSGVMNELTKKPVEPITDSDIKHFTLKTASLLARLRASATAKSTLGLQNKVLNHGQWEKVALFPSSDFIAKN